MEVRVEGDKLIIELPIQKRPSKSGKTILIASSNGPIPTTAQYEGKVVTVGVNAYIHKG